MDSRIICLKSDKKRVDNVNNNIIPYLDKYNIFEAIDGQKPELYQFIKDNEIKITNNYQYVSLKGQIACSCSHYSIWKEIVANEISNMIIIEDDAVLSNNFNEIVGNILDELPENYDMCYLYVYEDHYQKENQNSQIEGKEFITKGYYTWTTLCYIISLSGAKKLLNEFKVLDNHTDEKLGRMVKENKLNSYCSNKVFVKNGGQKSFDLYDKGLKSNIWYSGKY